MPKGKGKGAGPIFFGSKGGKGAWGKGKGKGKGKISEFDDSGWAHVGAASEWNWAQGTDWAAAPEWPPSGAWPGQAAQAEAVPPPPWIAAAQPAWPPASTPSWPSAPGTPPGLRSMSPSGGVYSLSMAPVPTKNRFEALTDRYVVDSDGAQISQENTSI